MPLKLYPITMQQKSQENISRNLIASRAAFVFGTWMLYKGFLNYQFSNLKSFFGEVFRAVKCCWG